MFQNRLSQNLQKSSKDIFLEYSITKNLEEFNSNNFESSPPKIHGGLGVNNALESSYEDLNQNLSRE